ncbi:Uncharacterised protein [Chromobacterium violaceum]|uniref:Uncharacterized protein n=1 Tax=Chromobacterium violaceum TaxID=536 RepID=A0A447TK60_CHRVL|nr:Uncharacterised protein [Chromobacterium violaceum]
MPFLHAFLENSWPLLLQCLNEKQVREWYGAMLADLDEDGCAALRRWLDEMMPVAAANDE